MATDMWRTLSSIALSSASCAFAGAGIVSIDDVSGTCSESLLAAGGTHVVSIRYDLSSSPPEGFWAGHNAFEVYSPDGADWGYLQGATGPLIATAASRGTMSVFLKHYYYDGSVWTETGNGGADPAPGSGGIDTRAGVYLSNFSLFNDAGYLGGLDNDIALTLEFETSMADVGKTICVNRNSEIVAWEWTNGTISDFPSFDNGLGVDEPRCFEIYTWPNLSPEWCGGQVGDAIWVGDYYEASYTLCAVTYGCPPPPPHFSLVPPYDNGDYGEVDPSTGVWTWSRPELQAGTYEIEFMIDGADYNPFTLHVQVALTGCECSGRVGDANCTGGDEPTIGDITYMINRKFIFVIAPRWCNLHEADINQSGGTDPVSDDITIGDISILVDYLFITGPSLGLPNCL